MAAEQVEPTAEVQKLRKQAEQMEDELVESIKEEAVNAHDEQIGGAELEKTSDEIGEAFGDKKDADSKDEKPLEDKIIDADAEIKDDAVNGDSRASMTTKDAEEEEPQYEEEGDIGQSALDQLSEVAKEKPELDKAKVIEAALLLANKPLTPAELALLSHCTVKQATRFIYNLQAEYDERKSALMIEFLNNEARLQVRSEYLPAVSQLSKEIELSRKGLKILALIAKKGQILQSGLKNYFRGEIYEYVTELKERGYIISEKHGNTRMLKPTRKFFEHFQQAQ
ncbi:MAG: SMC-Scp complex subunit ScpB [Candidatus Micrarchaeia archaeon]|jgi:chromosome segregation and condensation protein ScpB